ncbi:MAG: hypothetical protein HY599_06550 [Candidatus Omnitrophica bacterium]|nr:hypothetical protein [Candidatus Omnitrophota bacterium]
MSQRTGRARRLRWLLIGSLALTALIGSLTATLTTRQGVNFQVTAAPLPAYVKAIDFLHRDAHYYLLAREITRGLPAGRRAAADRDRALAVFRWTQEHLRPTPEGWPVVDDHILHIIIRGHGVADQYADVFTTLSTYAGVPAFWQPIREPASGRTLILSYAKVDGRWAVFDVFHGVVFSRPSGELISAEELAADPALADVASGSLPYRQLLTGYRAPVVPRPLRAELQMPWPRAVHTLHQMVGGTR